MRDPGALVEAVVTKLRAMAPLVTLLGGEDRILAYHEDEPSLQVAIEQLAPEQVLVAWRSTLPLYRAQREIWQHSVAVVFKQYAIFPLLANTVATGDTQNFRWLSIDDSVYPMGGFACDRRTLMVTDTLLMDYFEATLTLMERGDY